VVPASLTTLMTAYVTFQALKAGTVTPDTQLMCSKEATEQAPSKLWLKVGESITLDVALKVLIVQSAPDFVDRNLEKNVRSLPYWKPGASCWSLWLAPPNALRA
jgi:hypothetical protein